MSWKPLQLSNSSGAQLPSFLISSEFDSDSYLVRLTDLSNTWAERVDRDAIVERSKEDNTSIDPSEDEDQLSIFLEKIKIGLAGGKDTNLSLQVGAGIGDNLSPDLILHVTIPLPGGLKDLEWRYRLTPQSPKETVDKLFLPSLVALQENRKGVEELVELLEEKDAVIQKLVDTLESQGTDLGTIFHQAAGRPGRKVDRKKASEKVKGLKIFDVRTWRRGLGSDKTGDTWELLNKVFFDDEIGSKLPTTNDLGREDRQPDWWDRMQGKTVGTSGNKVATSPMDLPRRNTKQEPIPPEDDFQVQSTPPHISRPKFKPDIPMEDSTEDEGDDIDAPSQRSRLPDSVPISQARAPSPNQTPTPSPNSPLKAKTTVEESGTKRKAPTPSPPSQNADDTTEDDEPIPASSHSTRTIDNDNDNTDDDTPSSPPSKRQQTPQKSPTPQSPPAKKKGKLGKIGGKKAPSPSPEPELEPEVEPAAIKPRPKRGMLGKIGGKKGETTSTPEIEPQSSASPKKKLGTIGGKKAAAGSASQREDTIGEDNRGRGREQMKEEQEKMKEKTPPPRETSQERADKKRAMLKKELEAKSKAPVKKKRKF
ncbi:hypothetical protein SBOR_0667 [Sclerotinia borealis F-4128]|uniref:Non-homologous end-joining factor 1 n=1 Tax=Sclerotinia borealis (strain F-4128) TaxID=1432307 RepID=W9CWJ7_SCLBF|nr:hypothetical protein SBOR_0667 [Sclerotinia borealis F-4128]